MASKETIRYHCGLCSAEFMEEEELMTHLSLHMETSNIEYEGQEIQTPDIKSHGGRRSVIWNEETVDVLLAGVRRFYGRLTGRAERRTAVWRDLFASITNQLPGINIEQCQQKWKNLRKNFIAYIEGTKHTGMGTMSKPVGYEVMCTFLLERPLTNPQTSSCGLTEPLSPPVSDYCNSNGLTDEDQSSGPASAVSSPGPSSRSSSAASSSGEGVSLHIEAGRGRGHKRKRIRPSPRSGPSNSTLESVLEQNVKLTDMVSSYLQQNLELQQKLYEEEKKKTRLLDEILKSKPKQDD